MLIFIIVIIIITNAQPAFADPSQSAQIVFTVALNAANESSTDTSHATATGWAILSGDRTTLAYNITYAHLTSKFSGSHFHLGFTGVNGPVIKPIQFSGNSASGTWTSLPDSVVADLLNGQIYINIHSSNYPGGEIRGQVMPAKGIPLTITLDANQVATSVDTSKATGTGWAVLNTVGAASTLTYGITIAGLTTKLSASHFHIGVAKQNGSVIDPISFNDSSSYGTWTNISDANLLALIKNGVYVNVHTPNYPSGEIRGQLNVSGPISFTASIDGTQETPHITTNGNGTGWFILNPDSSSLAYRVTYAKLSSNFTASHFHLGAKGVAGFVVEPITYNGNTASGVWKKIPDSLVTSLVKNNLYVNVHSTNHPGGEIRGQVMLNPGVALIASLDGSQNVPTVSTIASGTAWLSLVNDTLNYQITIAGLMSAYNASHFHLAAKGVNGNVVEPITFSDSTATSTWANLSSTDLSALVKGNIYINIHTFNHPGGEIRGQVIASDFDSVTSILTGVKNVLGSNSIPVKYELYQNYPNPFNPTTVVRYNIPAGGLVSLKVYDVLGREVATLVNKFQQAGNYNVEFNYAKQLSSGIYLYRLNAGNFSQTKKMILLK